MFIDHPNNTHRFSHASAESRGFGTAYITAHKRRQEEYANALAQQVREREQRKLYEKQQQVNVNASSLEKGIFDSLGNNDSRRHRKNFARGYKAATSHVSIPISNLQPNADRNQQLNQNGTEHPRRPHPVVRVVYPEVTHNSVIKNNNGYFENPYYNQLPPQPGNLGPTTRSSLPWHPPLHTSPSKIYNNSVYYPPSHYHLDEHFAPSQHSFQQLNAPILNHAHDNPTYDLPANEPQMTRNLGNQEPAINMNNRTVLNIGQGVQAKQAKALQQQELQRVLEQQIEEKRQQKLAAKRARDEEDRRELERIAEEERKAKLEEERRKSEKRIQLLRQQQIETQPSQNSLSQQDTVLNMFKDDPDNRSDDTKRVAGPWSTNSPKKQINFNVTAAQTSQNYSGQSNATGQIINEFAPENYQYVNKLHVPEHALTRIDNAMGSHTSNFRPTINSLSSKNISSMCESSAVASNQYFEEIKFELKQQRQLVQQLHAANIDLRNKYEQLQYPHEKGDSMTPIHQIEKTPTLSDLEKLKLELRAEWATYEQTRRSESIQTADKKEQSTPSKAMEFHYSQNLYSEEHQISGIYNSKARATDFHHSEPDMKNILDNQTTSEWTAIDHHTAKTTNPINKQRLSEFQPAVSLHSDSQLIYMNNDNLRNNLHIIPMPPPTAINFSRPSIQPEIKGYQDSSTKYIISSEQWNNFAISSQNMEEIENSHHIMQEQINRSLAIKHISGDESSLVSETYRIAKLPTNTMKENDTQLPIELSVENRDSLARNDRYSFINNSVAKSSTVNSSELPQDNENVTREFQLYRIDGIELQKIMQLDNEPEYCDEEDSDTDEDMSLDSDELTVIFQRNVLRHELLLKFAQQKVTNNDSEEISGFRFK